jgi:hypothetical protein
MFARMLVHENAGVAGYSEAFMYGQSGKQASIGSSYLITDVLGYRPFCMTGIIIV